MIIQAPDSFQSKDYVTLIASIFAVAFSSISYFQKNAEGKQGLRKQLTETLKELSELNLRDATFRALKDRSAYPPNLPGLLADERRFFVLQAAWLADRLGDKVSSHEIGLIAGTFDSIDFVEDAERLFGKAVAMAKNAVDLGLARRNYGRFLLNQFQLEEGRTQYREAVKAFSGENDRLTYYRGDTYVRWAEQEVSAFKNADVAINLLNTARECFILLRSAKSRATNLERVEDRLTPLLDIEARRTSSGET